MTNAFNFVTRSTTLLPERVKGILKYFLPYLIQHTSFSFCINKISISCWCGSTHEITTSTNCNTQCAGNSSQICGGPNDVKSVYQIKGKQLPQHV